MQTSISKQVWEVRANYGPSINGCYFSQPAIMSPTRNLLSLHRFAFWLCQFCCQLRHRLRLEGVVRHRHFLCPKAVIFSLNHKQTVLAIGRTQWGGAMHRGLGGFGEWGVLLSGKLERPQRVPGVLHRVGANHMPILWRQCATGRAGTKEGTISSMPLYNWWGSQSLRLMSNFFGWVGSFDLFHREWIFLFQFTTTIDSVAVSEEMFAEGMVEHRKGSVSSSHPHAADIVSSVWGKQLSMFDMLIC